MKRQTAERWDELIDALEAWLTALRPGVLDRVQVITSSAGAARLAGQALASRIGILAGVDLLPADRWVTQLEAELGDREASPWRGRSLELAVQEVLTDPDFLDCHPVVATHLKAGPGRLRGVSQRVATLMRCYQEHRPEMLAQWLASPSEAARRSA